MVVKSELGYRLDSSLLDRQVNVLVVGAGGSGSHMVADLAVLHQSMLDLGHPFGLAVTVADGDTVTHANVGRARFYASDVGSNKASVMVHRVNVCHGLSWRAIEAPVTEDSPWVRDVDLVIGCVDTRSSRRTIKSLLERRRWGRPVLYLDLGNGELDGQVILGEVGGTGKVLPCVTDLYPEMLDPALDPVDDGPSCSRAEALRKQSAFVNKAASMHAVSMLSVLFSSGALDHHGVFFNLKTGRCTTLAADPSAWKRFGFECAAAAS
jgi:PRTRC genetic system ThiF family protein